MLHLTTILLLAVFFPRVSIAQNDSSVTANQQGAKQNLTPNELAQIWTNIKNTDTPLSDKVKDGSPESWFLEVKVGHEELKKIIDSSNQREGLEYFVNQFGRGGAQADMRWLIAARTMMLPADRNLKPTSQDDKLRQAQNAFAELQVRQFLEHPRLLDRYYHSVIWFDHMFNKIFFSTYLGNVQKKLQSDKSQNDYWWYAQNLLLLVHATNRDDLLEDAKPEELIPVFEQWYQWLKINGIFLTASPDGIFWLRNEANNKIYLPFLKNQTLPPLENPPKYPFPDWVGKRPTTPKNYRALE
ncbi:MAG: hypothetical protein CME32_01100 [Gimesia sp.]|nr:hypothetical protein [Gimesia sp.]